jgi:hypothetical protein
MVGRCVSREHLLTVWCPRLIGCGCLGSQSWQDAEGRKQGLSAPFRRAAASSPLRQTMRPAFAGDSGKLLSAICYCCVCLRFLRPGWSIWRLDDLAELPDLCRDRDLGHFPGSFAFATAGNGLDSVIEAQQAQYQSCLAKMGAGGQESCSYAPDPRALLIPERIAGRVGARRPWRLFRWR